MNIMQQIQNYGTKIRKATEIIGPVEADAEYQLIVEANDLAAEIDNEVVCTCLINNMIMLLI